MNIQKHEGNHSFRNKGLVLAALTILLLGIAIIRIKFPALSGNLYEGLFIAALVQMGINVFRKKK